MPNTPPNDSPTPETPSLDHPWLVAVWPGMGNVAINAGYYLMSKLGMSHIAEFSAEDLFDVEHVAVRRGVVETAPGPRSRFFAWKDPRGEHDIVVFLGEAQPSAGKFAFSRRLVEFAQALGVERVFTFAAMATEMKSRENSRVFVAATTAQYLAELAEKDVSVLENGHIGGLNGVLLAAAAQSGLRAACLLGEIPESLPQMACPRASLAVLEVFVDLAGIEIDLTELASYVEAFDGKFADDELQSPESSSEDQDSFENRELASERTEDRRVSTEDESRIESLFREAHADRSKAYELKRELDRLELFQDYEDRFLDLFKNSA